MEKAITFFRDGNKYETYRIDSIKNKSRGVLVRKNGIRHELIIFKMPNPKGYLNYIKLNN